MAFSLAGNQRLMQEEMAKAFARIAPLHRVREIAQAEPSLDASDDVWAGLCGRRPGAFAYPMKRSFRFGASSGSGSASERFLYRHTGLE